MEIQRIHDDRRISVMLETFLAFSIEARKAGQLGIISDHPKIKVRLAVYEWYLCRYAPDHTEELEYVRQAFPYNYRSMKAFWLR